MSFLRSHFAKKLQLRANKDAADAQKIIDCIMRSPKTANHYLNDIRKTYKGRQSIATAITILEASLERFKESKYWNYAFANESFVDSDHTRIFLIEAEITESKDIKPHEMALIVCRKALTSRQIETNTGVRIRMRR